MGFFIHKIYIMRRKRLFEAHGMSFPCTELLLLNYAKVKKVFHSIAFQNLYGFGVFKNENGV